MVINVVLLKFTVQVLFLGGILLASFLAIFVYKQEGSFWEHCITYILASYAPKPKIKDLNGSISGSSSRLPIIDQASPGVASINSEGFFGNHLGTERRKSYKPNEESA